MDKMVFVHDDNCFPNEFACLSERHLACDDQITPYSEDYVYGFASAEGLASGNTNEVALSDKDKKRPSDSESCLQASKRLKQVDQHLQSSSFEEICTSAAQLSPGVFDDSKDHQLLIVDSEEFPTELKSHCFAQELPVRLPFCLGSSGYGCRASDFDRSEEILLPLYYGFSRKRVAIGGNHQADIPAWRPCELKNRSRDSECASHWNSITTSSYHNFETDSNKWLGTQVMPMPESSLLALDDPALHHKVDCSCIDDGSIRCVRQHVTRSREMIKQDIGLERFEQLGFGNMGEVVAQSWTEEEEQLFAEIVSLNPASLGNNFWNKMPLFFPDKSSKEVVSYYFNVFMLRRRAVQNRLDPLHVDSDNEELQENDDGEFVSEEDSVESPVSAEEDDVADDEDLDEMETIEEVDCAENHRCYKHTYDEKYSCGDAEGYIDAEESTFASGTQLAGSKLPPSADYDIQDESCTSFEGPHNGIGFEDPIGSFPLEDVNLVYKDDQTDGFLNGHGDLQAWDKSYSSGGSEKDEFLSTVHVIEEVFGKEDI
ncbi:uncharacterized protein LOC121995780 isoform X1 [Zingiber officinale]|uniref:uncharacterized protein LOC121995780 isoform X1 n=2 Tax=Zingiber officinale TaxID=94328 RepID=UPI001C4BA81E|nr:uncharacterized protein LOC121995780 isoform X1 [Zingiber officinale]XP_042405481.1 uncharacterized protein LOC121995780 isoform X1 [Zingiber officinale]